MHDHEAFIGTSCSNGEEELEATDGLIMNHNLDLRRAQPVARVAIAVYGLFRHDCGSINFDAIFKDPLKKSSRYTYIVDVMTHANIVAHEDGAKRQGSDRIASRPTGTTRISPFLFTKFKPCKFDTTDQDLVDDEIEPALVETCGKVGDFWDTKGKPNPDGTRSEQFGLNTECKTTKNLFRSFYSQKKAAQLVLAHERESRFQYDVVVVVRGDVLFTRPMNVDYFDLIVRHGKEGIETLFTPDWARFNGRRKQDGYNDRFVLGHRGPTLHVMQRLDYVADHVADIGKGPFFKDEASEKRIHSESFMRWVVDRYSESHRDSPGARFDLRIVHDFFFRRVRSDGKRHPLPYASRHMH